MHLEFHQTKTDMKEEALKNNKKPKSATNTCVCLVYIIYGFIIWLQKYTHSDWLLSGHYFLVMTGHYEIFSRLDGSFE